MDLTNIDVEKIDLLEIEGDGINCKKGTEIINPNTEVRENSHRNVKH